MSVDGNIVIKDSIISNNITGYKINGNITVYNYNSFIKWYQFKKKKQEGYKMNLRNIFSSKVKENVSSSSSCFEANIHTIKKINE